MKLNNIRQIRKDLGMSLYKLEELSGISHSTINDIEAFRHIPNQITMMSISKGLRKRTEEVFVLDWSLLNNYENK